MVNKIDYLAIFKELLDVFEGRKPKKQDFYNKAYLIAGILDQVSALQEFCLFIKENTRLEYESGKKLAERKQKNADGEIVSVMKQVPDYKNVVLKFNDDCNAVSIIKEIYHRNYPQEWENGMPK